MHMPDLKDRLAVHRAFQSEGGRQALAVIIRMTLFSGAAPSADMELYHRGMRDAGLKILALAGIEIADFTDALVLVDHKPKSKGYADE